MHLNSFLATDTSAVEGILGTASGVLMLALALAVVAAIAFVPLRPRAEQGPLDRILIDIAVIVAIGVALMYLLLPVLRAETSIATVAIYAILLAVEVGWVWAIRRTPSRGLLLAGIIVNVAALPFALWGLASAPALDGAALAVLEGAAVLLCAAVLWPRTGRWLGQRLVSADFAATGRAATMATVGLLVLLALAGPGHGHSG